MQRFLRIERLVGEQDLHRLDVAQLLCERASTGAALSGDSFEILHWTTSPVGTS
jgi:hypothetical protein